MALVEPTRSRDLLGRAAALGAEHADGADGSDLAARRTWSLLRVLPYLSVLGGLGTWQLAAALRLVDPLFLPSLGTTVQRLSTDLAGGGLTADLRASAVPFATGLLVAIVAGCVVGTLMGLSRVVDQLLVPWVLGFNAVPRIAFVSVFIVVFGLGILGKAAVVTATAVLPMVLTMRSGVRSIDPDLVEMARSFDVRRGLLLRRVVLPATLPFFVAGFRITIALALIGQVVAEFFSARAGIGHRLNVASQTYDITEVYAMILVLAIVGIALAQGVTALEKRIQRWHGSAHS